MGNGIVDGGATLLTQHKVCVCVCVYNVHVLFYGAVVLYTIHAYVLYILNIFVTTGVAIWKFSILPTSELAAKENSPCFLLAFNLVVLASWRY
jgi:hypothetical protein